MRDEIVAVMARAMQASKAWPVVFEAGSAEALVVAVLPVVEALMAGRRDADRREIDSQATRIAELEAAVKQILRFFGKWPEFVPADDYAETAMRALRDARAALEVLGP